jgi:hypothetical protein
MRHKDDLAAGLAVPVRVADALMDRLAVPVTGEDLLGPFTRRTPARPSGPRLEPVNLAFASALDGWVIGGDSRCEVTGAHWDDYTVAAGDGAAILTAALPHPYGSVFLGQEFLASGYLGTTLTLRAEVRAQDVADHAVLSLRIICKEERSEHQDSPAAPHRIRGPVLQRLPPAFPAPPSPAAKTGRAIGSPRRSPPTPIRWSSTSPLPAPARSPCAT